MLCLLLLPFQLFFGLLFLPFIILRGIVKLMVGLAVLPFVLLFTIVAVGAALFVLAAAVLVPLLPFAFAAAFIWLLVRLASPRHHITHI